MVKIPLVDFLEKMFVGAYCTWIDLAPLGAIV